MCQTQIAELEVMSVSLAVCRDVHQLAASADELLHQSTTRGECAFESNRTREWSIVEENSDGTIRSIRVTEEIRLRGINNPLPLVRREDDVTQALLDKKRENLIVGSSLRQPE